MADKTYTNDEKMDSLVTTAITAIQAARANGEVPLLIVFSRPPKFQTARLLSPNNLDTMQVLDFIWESVHCEDITH